MSRTEQGAGGPGPGDRLRLGFFGAFHPMTDRAGAASTGMVLMLGRSPRLQRLVVFGPQGSRPIDGIEMPGTDVVPCWAPDDVPSLLGALRAMTRRAGELDGYLFAIYPTFFGRSAAANGLGLLLPVLVRRLTGRPVVVFMHNFVESQDIKTLGYDVSPATVSAARWLERRIGRSTRVAAGLESMAATARATLRVPVEYIPVRFLESVPGLLSPTVTPEVRRNGGHIGAARVLFFGTWGPQKDLTGALEALRPLADGKDGITVTIAGDANPNFPEYARQLKELAGHLPRSSFRFRGHVEENEVPVLFRTHDVLVLPYRTSGGYSGVMNVAGAYGIRVVAYDHPQLRECARLLGLAAEFVPDGDAEALRGAIGGEATRGSAPTPQGTAARLRDAQSGVESLIDLFDPADPGPGPRSAPVPPSPA